MDCGTGLLAALGPTWHDKNAIQGDESAMTAAAAYVPINRRSIDAVSWGCEHLAVFGVGAAEAAIWYRFWEGPVKDQFWINLGGESATPPTPITSERGDIDVFYVAKDKSTHVKNHNGSSWGDWQSLSGLIYSNLAAVSWGPGHVAVLGLGGSSGQDPFIKTKSNGTWAPSWQLIPGGGKIKSDLSAVSWGPGRIDVFGIGLDDRLYTRSYENGQWLDSGWSNLGGGFSSPPTAVSRGDGKLDVFGIAKSGTLQWRSYKRDGGGWSDEVSLGGTTYSAISAKVSSFFGVKRIDIVVLGGTDRVYHIAYSEANETWSGWTSHGRAFDTKPVIAGGAFTDRLDILSLGQVNSPMLHQAWNGSSWDPTVDTWVDENGAFLKYK
ncbi:MAG: hypothetical protein Q9222_005178 [Ikaeria aurantiellina]